MIKFLIQKDLTIREYTDKEEEHNSNNSLYTILTRFGFNSGKSITEALDIEIEKGYAYKYFDTKQEAEKALPKYQAITNAKNHIAITSMANSVMLTTFYLYADTDKNSTIDKEKLKLAMRELLRCQAIYVKTNDYGLFDPIALNDLKDVYDLMEQEDKDNIKDNLEIYSWFEPKAPFIEFYKAIGGKLE